MVRTSDQYSESRSKVVLLCPIHVFPLGKNSLFFTGQKILLLNLGEVLHKIREY